MRPFITQNILLNTVRTTIGRRLGSSSARGTLFTPKLATRVAGLTMATSVGIAAPWIYNLQNTIYNDAVVDAHRSPGAAVAALAQGSVQEPAKRKSRLDGKLDYRQLCMGSILGLVLGVVVGKVSTLLVYVTAAGLLGLQWLQNRGIVDKNATQSLFARYIVKSGRETLDLNTLIWERPSFKLSFLLTFVLAAANI